MLKIPFFEELQTSKNILLAGCGGGYDIYSGIPLFLLLKSHDKNVYLANYTFTRINQLGGRKFTEHCTIIDKETILPKVVGYNTFYCPEYDLTDYFHKKKGWDIPIFTLHPVGPKLLKETYQALAKELNLDTIILIDGGTDSLLRGDETSLGTPREDITSIISAHSVPIKKKYLVCVGFGTDDRHEVAHYDVLKRIANLINLNAFKGCFSLMKEMEEVKTFIEVIYHSNKRVQKARSYVQNYIVSALNGEFGGRSRFINPLNAQVWCFDLDIVYKQILYASEVEELYDLGQVWAQIMRFREKNKIKTRKLIPI